MKSVDIINVAGLLMDGENDAMEIGLKQLQPRSLRTIAPTPPGSAREHPCVAIERLIVFIQQAILAIQQEFGESNVVLVGRSYGAFMALQAAIRMNFDNISRLVLVEGPLHPDVLVRAPLLFPAFMMCGVHYDARPVLAQEAVDRLKNLGTSRLVIVQSTARDVVVPNDAQVLPGDFETVEFSDDSLSRIIALNRLNGLILKLPDDLCGERRGVRGFLPREYRTHTSWNQQKMNAVVSIVHAASTGDQSL